MVARLKAKKEFDDLAAKLEGVPTDDAKEEWAKISLSVRPEVRQAWRQILFSLDIKGVEAFQIGIQLIRECPADRLEALRRELRK